MEIIEFLEEYKVGKSFLKLVKPFISHEWNMKRKIDNAELQFKINLRKAENEGQVNLQKKKHELEVKKQEIENQYELDQFKKDVVNNWFQKESRYQNNVDEVVAKSVKHIKEDAKPEEVDIDWINDFFDKCKLISNNDIQTIWAKILSGEVNEPGAFSKRTLVVLSNLDKNDIELFDNMCKFSWNLEEPILRILDYQNEIYKEGKMFYFNLQHMASIGLVHLSPVADSIEFEIEDSKKIDITYYGKVVSLNFPNKVGRIKTGVVHFSKAGKE